jgi:hypothetical protein
MFTAKRQVATVVGNCLRMLPGSPVAGQRVLMYHAVGNRVDGDINNIYTMSRTDFLRHIETLQTVSAKRNMPFAPFRQSNNTEIAVTFDDGYADALSTIGPELSKRGIPAVSINSRTARACHHSRSNHWCAWRYSPLTHIDQHCRCRSRLTQQQAAT